MKTRVSPSGIFENIEGGGGLISWRLDGTGDVKTWAEVMALVTASKVPLGILLTENANFPVPASPTPYDMKQSYFVAPVGASDVSVVKLVDGAVLKDLASVNGGMTLQGQPTINPCLLFTQRAPGNPLFFRLRDNGTVSNTGTVPMITLLPGVDMVFIAEGGAYKIGNPAVAFIHVSNTAQLFFEILLSFGIGQPDPIGFITGAVGSALAWVHDDTMNFPPPSIPGFLGGIINVAIGNVGGAGPTSFRPFPAFGGISLGCTYFDTTLIPPKPIFWDGAQWVDANGVGPV